MVNNLQKDGGEFTQKDVVCVTSFLRMGFPQIGPRSNRATRRCIFLLPIAESEEIIATLATSQERREESGIVWYAAAMQIRREASTNTSYLCHFSLSFPHCTVPFLTSHLSASLFALSSAQEKTKQKDVARARDRICTVNLTCSHFKCSSRELHPSGRPTNCWLTPDVPVP